MLNLLGIEKDMKYFLIDLFLAILALDIIVFSIDASLHLSLAMWQCTAGWEVCNWHVIGRRFFGGWL